MWRFRRGFSRCWFCHLWNCSVKGKLLFSRYIRIIYGETFDVQLKGRNMSVATFWLKDSIDSAKDSKKSVKKQVSENVAKSTFWKTAPIWWTLLRRICVNILNSLDGGGVTTTHWRRTDSAVAAHEFQTCADEQQEETVHKWRHLSLTVKPNPLHFYSVNWTSHCVVNVIFWFAPILFLRWRH